MTAPAKKARAPQSLPEDAVGLNLYRVNRQGDLIGCEAVLFERGWPAVDTVLRRAAISGRVEIGGAIEDHFADVLDANASILETVALDARSYRALKTRWMPCKVSRS